MIISILNQYIQFRYTLTIIPFDDNCTSFLRKTSKFLPNSFFNIFGPIKKQNVHVIISIFMVIARCSYKIECIFFHLILIYYFYFWVFCIFLISFSWKIPIIIPKYFFNGLHHSLVEPRCMYPRKVFYFITDKDTDRAIPLI